VLPLLLPLLPPLLLPLLVPLLPPLLLPLLLPLPFLLLLLPPRRKSIFAVKERELRLRAPPWDERGGGRGRWVGTKKLRPEVNCFLSAPCKGAIFS